MELTQKNLENHGWLFSPSLSVMVRENELGNGKWDIELDSYKNVAYKNEPPIYDFSNDWWDAADTLTELITKNPELKKTKDWMDGDRVNFV